MPNVAGSLILPMKIATARTTTNSHRSSFTLMTGKNTQLPRGLVDVVTRRLQCAGINRHEAEDESSLRERSSDPLGLESCAGIARYSAKRRQRIGGVGIQLRKDAI